MHYLLPHAHGLGVKQLIVLSIAKKYSNILPIFKQLQKLCILACVYLIMVPGPCYIAHVCTMYLAQNGQSFTQPFSACDITLWCHACEFRYRALNTWEWTGDKAMAEGGNICQWLCFSLQTFLVLSYKYIQCTCIWKLHVPLAQPVVAKFHGLF